MTFRIYMSHVVIDISLKPETSTINFSVVQVQKQLKYGMCNSFSNLRSDREALLPSSMTSTNNSSMRIGLNIWSLNIIQVILSPFCPGVFHDML